MGVGDLPRGGSYPQAKVAGQAIRCNPPRVLVIHRPSAGGQLGRVTSAHPPGGGFTGAPGGYYPDNVARYQGPCIKCGADVDRRIKPGKQHLCLPCALGKMTEQQQGFAKGTDPAVARSREAGAKAAADIRAGRGPVAQRWAAGMQRYLDRVTTTHGETSDTFPA